MSFAVSDSASYSLMRQRLDAVYAVMLNKSKVQLSGPGGIAYRVGLLRASDREKFQIAAAKWGPAFEQVVASIQRWMDARNQLLKKPESDWGVEGELLAESGQKIVNAISELAKNVTNADWLRTQTYLTIAVRAAASIPTITVAAAKYTINAAGEVTEAAGTAIGKGGSAIGRGLAATLAPLKWPLIGVGVLFAIFYLAPVARVAMSTRRSSRAS